LLYDVVDIDVLRFHAQSGSVLEVGGRGRSGQREFKSCPSPTAKPKDLEGTFSSTGHGVCQGILLLTADDEMTEAIRKLFLEVLTSSSNFQRRLSVLQVIPTQEGEW
jgi:hypothetical protein